MTRAAIYARVSSAAQRDAHTVESQLGVLRPFVKSRGWELVETYVDDGRSAKTGALEKREAFARCVRDAGAGRYDVLVVFDVDRLTRTDSIEERAQILGPFQRANIRIVSPSSEIDLRTMFGQLDVTLRAIYAAEENRKRADRIKAGKARAIAEGRKPAGPTPYGLAYSRATGQWSIDPVCGPIVAEIFRRVIAGESCMVIAADLHERGVPRPRSSAWTRHFAWRIVRQRYPVGEWSPDKRTRALIRVPAIIDESTWQAAQAKLIEHGKRGLVKAHHVYLLQGLAVCGHCGEPMSIRSPTPQRRGRVQPAAYVCRARKLALPGLGRCDSAILRTSDVDDRVWSIVERALASEQLVSAVRRRFAERDANRSSWKADVARYEARLAQIERASAGILGRYRRGLISDAALDLELAASGKERATVTEQLERARRAAKAHVGPQVGAEEWLGALRSLAATQTPEERQRVVRAIVRTGAAVFVDGDVEIDLELHAPAEQAAPVFSAVAAGCRTHHGATVRLRVVA